MGRQEKEIGDHAKTLTFLILGISVAAYCFPRFSELLVYDRQAILNGQMWRLLTAPFVHFSASHLFWDTLLFGAAGFAIAYHRYRGLWMVCAFSTVIPSLLFLVTLPHLERYGGLSGLATGAVAYFCLCRALRTKEKRMIWLFILVGTGIKIMAETVTGFPLFVEIDGIPFRVLPSAHIIGYLGAFAAALLILPDLLGRDAEGSKTDLSSSIEGGL
jgi:rhomboid family GlyGly-CTERM serine protease